MGKVNTKDIIFITGAFVGHSCWNDWISYFNGKGYNCVAPPWPAKDAAPEELRRRQPDEAIAAVRLKALVSHYENIVRQFAEKPIVIGHSLGGLLTQIMVNRDLAAAGVAIHSVPPQGIVPTQLSFYRATWKALGLFTSTRKSYLMSFRDWQYAFTNGMAPADQQAAYNRFAIPESKLCLRDGLTSDAKVDLKKAHVPLLILAGDKDHCIPAALNLTNYKKYSDANSVTDYKVFPGRNHFVLGQPTWQEDADYILNWLDIQ